MPVRPVEDTARRLRPAGVFPFQGPGRNPQPVRPCDNQPMDRSELLRSLTAEPAVAIDRDDLAGLLETADAVHEDHTAIAGTIRTLRCSDRIVVQERNPEGQLFVREVESLDAARRFVQARLDAYERMWDG